MIHGPSSKKTERSSWVDTRVLQDANKMKIGGTWLGLPAGHHFLALGHRHFSNKWINMVFKKTPKTIAIILSHLARAHICSFSTLWLVRALVGLSHSLQGAENGELV